MDMLCIQSMLGHSCIETTKINIPITQKIREKLCSLLGFLDLDEDI
jgi:site-specific recombinase XerD